MYNLTCSETNELLNHFGIKPLPSTNIFRGQIIMSDIEKKNAAQNLSKNIERIAELVPNKFMPESLKNKNTKLAVSKHNFSVRGSMRILEYVLTKQKIRHTITKISSKKIEIVLDGI